MCVGRCAVAVHSADAQWNGKAILIGFNSLFHRGNLVAVKAVPDVPVKVDISSATILRSRLTQ